MARVLIVALLVAASGAHAATWDGGGGDSLWSTATNWMGDVAPAPGDNLTFPVTAAQFTTTNDTAAVYGRITIGASGYLLQGATVTLTDGITTTYTSGTSEIRLPLAKFSDQMWFVAAGGTLRLTGDIENHGILRLHDSGNYVIEAVVSGTGPIYVIGGADVTLTNDNTFSGIFLITLGTVHANDPDGGTPATGTGTVMLGGGGGTLGGTGSAGNISASLGTLTGGTLADPTLTTGDVVFVDSFLSAELGVALLSPAVAPQLGVNGTVSLTGGALVFTYSPANVPPAGMQFLIIDNDGSDPIAGTFEGLPEGSLFSIGAETFRISYTGGDGNDVLIIATEADLSVTKVADDTTPTVGQNVTFTITVSNAGPTFASDVTLTDTLGAGLDYVSATPSQGTCSGTGPVTCNLGTINSGANAIVTLVATATTAGPLTNTASVTSPDADPSLANNTDTETVTAGAATPVVAVPALDALSLAALALLLVIAAAFVLRS